MRQRTLRMLALTLALLGPGRTAARAQGTLEDYKRAERFLPGNAAKLVFNAKVTPVWIGKGSRFWYRRESRDGWTFQVVDPARDTVRPAFDHARAAAALSTALGEPVNPKKLPFEAIRFADGGKAVEFPAAGSLWTLELASYGLRKGPQPAVIPAQELPSPDGKWIAFVEAHDLWVRPASGGPAVRLSSDGEALHAYACSSPGLREQLRAGGNPVRSFVEAVWSPDSTRILTWKIDERKARRLTIIQFAPPGANRPRPFDWVYPLPGDEDLALAEPVVFDVARRTAVRIDHPPLLLPLPMWKAAGRGIWTPDGRKVVFAETERGYRTVRLFEADPGTGRTRLLLTETSSTCVDPNMTSLTFVGGGAEFLWTSERDGWCHLYLFDAAEGRLKLQLTSGDFVVREVLRVEAGSRRVLFAASGREAGRDPYQRHAYAIGLEGKGLKLLTPEEADHTVAVSPDGAYLVDTYSRIDSAPVTVVRRASDGRAVREVERADVELLRRSGWPWPEPFAVKGRDGTTDIYGAIYWPSNFEPGRTYPVIDAIYNGPHAVRTPKSFIPSGPDQALAELGFIVVTVDALGTALRSKAFHDVSYANLGDSGLPDHVAALEQLAARHPQLDLGRVGIYGHSAGGYDAAHALLVRPDFYRVAVASSGTHDSRSDRVWWNELWMGYPVGDHYRRQANTNLAANLRGKLLLVHGGLDDSVHPAATLQLVDALVKANKDFDLLLLPDRGHDLGNGYFVRRLWDYFVRNLAGVEPPKEYPLIDPDDR